MAEGKNKAAKVPGQEKKANRRGAARPALGQALSGGADERTIGRGFDALAEVRDPAAHLRRRVYRPIVRAS